MDGKSTLTSAARRRRQTFQKSQRRSERAGVNSGLETLAVEHCSECRS